MRRLFLTEPGILMADLTVAYMKLAVGQMSLNIRPLRKQILFLSDGAAGDLSLTIGGATV